MSDVALLAALGGQPTKPTKYTPLTVRTSFTGLYTNRNVLCGPGTRADIKFYGGHPDTLIGGYNVEVTNKTTLVRRPGYTSYIKNSIIDPSILAVPVVASASTVNSGGSLLGNTTYYYRVAAINANGTTLASTEYSQHTATGNDLNTATINWGAVTGATGYNIYGRTTGGEQLLTSIPLASTIHTFTDSGSIIPFGVLPSTASLSLPSPAMSFYSWHGLNNSVLLFADTATNINVVTPSAITPIFTKTAGAGQAFYQEVGNLIYIGDGKDQIIFNGTTVSNWGIVGPDVLFPSTPPVLSFAVGTANTYQPTGWSYVYAYATEVPGNPGYFSVSNASAAANTGPQLLFKTGLTGFCTTDPQVTTILIFRTTDGGATYLYDASVPNSTVPGAQWTYQWDELPDTSLNAFIVAPLAGGNSPPPGGLINLAYWAGRLWGTIGNYVYYAAGPDTTIGDGQASWPALNYFQVPSRINKLIPYSQGLIVWTVDDVYIVQGNISAIGAQFVSGTIFSCTIFQPGMGLSSYNAADVFGSNIYAYTTDKRLLQITPGSGINDMGFPVSNLWGSVVPSNVFVSYYAFGTQDQALFFDDGLGNTWRCNPVQMPEGSICWSPPAVVAGGVGAMKAVETSYGVIQLLIGSGNNILYRDWTSNLDNGSTYLASATWGSFTLAQPGQLADVDSIVVESKAIGAVPLVSVLLDEISGPFTYLPQFVPDPPNLPTSMSLYSYRWYLLQSSQATVLRHMQLQLNFIAENYPNEILGFSIYGSTIPE